MMNMRIITTCRSYRYLCPAPLPLPHAKTCTLHHNWLGCGSEGTQCSVVCQSVDGETETVDGTSIANREPVAMMLQTPCPLLLFLTFVQTTSLSITADVTKVQGMRRPNAA